MFLKEIRLINFQGHSDTKISFTDKINVICGKSDVGKSSIRRAIDWILFGQNVKGIIKNGEKQCSVSILLDSDVEIERVRSKTVNRYILRKEGEEKTFDSIGKSIPDEIRNAIGITPIVVDGEELYLNSLPQLGLPFLFDKAPSFRAKLLNKLTGNDVLDTLFGEFNKDSLRISKDLKRETEILEKRKIELDNLEVEKEKKEVLFKKAEKIYKNVVKKDQKLNKLLEINKLNKDAKETQKETDILLKSIKIPQVSGLIKLIDKWDKIEPLQNALESTKSALDRATSDLNKIVFPDLNLGNVEAKLQRLAKLKEVFVNQTVKKEYLDVLYKLNSIKEVSFNFKECFEKIETLKKLKEVSISLDNTNKMLYTLKDENSSLEHMLVKNKEEYVEVLKKMDVCPLCGSKFSEDHLKEFKL